MYKLYIVSVSEFKYNAALLYHLFSLILLSNCAGGEVVVVVWYKEERRLNSTCPVCLLGVVMER